jgi:predicted nucleic acid-binding protein
VLARLAADHGVDVRRSSIHHDALIAASAREAGFTVVTKNLSDFEIIARYLSKLSFAPPYP